MRHAMRTEISVVGRSASCRPAPTRQRTSILHTIGCAGGPSFGGPRTTGAQASQSKTQTLSMLGRWSSFVPHVVGALATLQSNYRSTFQYAVAAGPGAPCLGVAVGEAQNNPSTLSLPLLHRSYTLTSMKVLSSFIPASSLESLHLKPAVAARRKRPASNHSIERTVKGLRPSPAAHVKR